MTYGDAIAILIFLALVVVVAAATWSYNRTWDLEKRGYAFLIGLWAGLALLISAESLIGRDWGPRLGGDGRSLTDICRDNPAFCAEIERSRREIEKWIENPGQFIRDVLDEK